MDIYNSIGISGYKNGENLYTLTFKGKLGVFIFRNHPMLQLFIGLNSTYLREGLLGVEYQVLSKLLDFIMTDREFDQVYHYVDSVSSDKVIQQEKAKGFYSE